ncbi:nitrile hydratase accessory protein [Agrobacterium vitis]|uniref:nitrile hydratase accessory protein n=1 Tax=Agrobacterium vitis TaxID=373 RepID=UPI001571B109|nr:nitrile hydratase accessory protein [Agrobacterium vitis]NSZ19919.1 nitrile hydratase accessory protein [Agrobacterium vitis]QZO07623.1 nitrile hydratase accessory protein [Agrobacterium vitis]UJL90819.1 nitrile hydratase accessory protein [Agrobacterium vitis]
MSAPVLTDMVQLPRDDAGPVFDRPWQAQAFALTVELYKSDLFTWPEWVEVFSEEIKAFPILPGESVNDAYYRQWMSALEKMVASRKLVEETDLLARTQEWRQAYLNTPHGQPILLVNASCPPRHAHDDHDDEHHHDGGHHHHHHHAAKRSPIAVSAAVSN